MASFLTSYSESLIHELELLKPLVEGLRKASSLLEKIEILNAEDRVIEFFSKTPLERLSLEQELVIKSAIAIGQREAFFPVEDLNEEVRKSKMLALMSTLWTLETFYREMGGLVGYHLTLLQFLYKPTQRFSIDNSKYHAPQGLDLSIPSSELTDAIYYSIEKMEELSELYPVGGAADRLKLLDPVTGAPLPAAMLSFNGKTMLGGLIEDLQAREYLYYKIKGKQITLPVAMMTSNEKDNHQQIIRLCEENNWFSRSREKFSFFCQPLVPVVDGRGDWVFLSSMQPLLKPGGHGVIWKLARDSGVFSWLSELGASKAVIRQINNPISSEDYGLLAFSGYGLKEGKRFGFSSCERQLKASEGINVVVEESSQDGFSYTLTNIEYCDFQTYGIEDEPIGTEKKYSKFPSNTNLLFVDLQSVLDAIDECPIPGMLVNFKKVSFKGAGGERREEEVARLESTMQNIADCFPKKSAKRLLPEELSNLDSYITFNKRRKTIAATKKEYVVGASFLETPEGCFLDMMRNMRELLIEHCNFQISESFAQEESFVSPDFLFDYHPALGPLYSIIGKKIRGGSLSLNSELDLQIAECDIENISVEGSFRVIASRVMGEIDSQGILIYSENVGRCFLKNVRVKNKGIDYEKENVFWKKEIKRSESCLLILEGHSEFYAENVLFVGPIEIRVEDGFKMIAKEVDGHLIFIKEKLSVPSWHWKYQFDLDRALIVEKNE